MNHAECFEKKQMCKLSITTNSCAICYLQIQTFWEKDISIWIQALDMILMIVYGLSTLYFAQLLVFQSCLLQNRFRVIVKISSLIISTLEWYNSLWMIQKIQASPNNHSFTNHLNSWQLWTSGIYDQSSYLSWLQHPCSHLIIICHLLFLTSYMQSQWGSQQQMVATWCLCLTACNDLLNDNKQKCQNFCC